MNRKCGLRNVTLFLAICASVLSACFCVLLMADDYFSARYKLDTLSKEFQGWEAFRQTKPAYYEANAEAVNTCLESLEDAKDNFWVKLPKTQSIGLLVLAGLGSATCGFLATWAIVWFVGLGIYRFIRLLAFCFRGKLFRAGLHNKTKVIYDEAKEPRHRLETVAVQKAKVRRDKELTFAAESLELIANGMDEWIKQQKDRITHTSVNFQKKWISRWFSDFFIMELFKDKVHKKHFGDIVDTFRLYMPDIAESLKEVWHNFLNYSKFMRQIQNIKHKAEDNHDLGYWCGNFLDKTARPTAKSLRRLSEQTRKHLTTQEQAKKKEEQPEEIIDKQVGKLTAQEQAKKKEERPEEVTDKQVDKLTSQKQVKKKGERPQEIIDKQVGKPTAQEQMKRKEERPQEVVDKQVDKLTAQEQAKKKEERPEETIDKQGGELTSQKQLETEKERPEGVLNKQVGILLESSPNMTASEIARMLNKNYAGVYKPISPSLVVKTESWKKYLEKVTVGG